MDGATIVYWRKKRHISQRILASKIPISVTQLSHYENNHVKNPSKEVEEKIINILSIPEDNKPHVKD